MEEPKNPYIEEWDKSTQAVDKFDNMLIDLRKYGFSFLTGLITASSLVGIAAGSIPLEAFATIEIAVITVTMILVITLYWLDIYYQNVLTGAIQHSFIVYVFVTVKFAL